MKQRIRGIDAEKREMETEKVRNRQTEEKERHGSKE